MAQRIGQGVRRGEPVTVVVNGRQVQAFAGETVATVLLAENAGAFNQTTGGLPRAPYCNMGTCFECQVQVATDENAAPRWLRACMTPVSAGLSIRTGATLGSNEWTDEDH